MSSVRPLARGRRGGGLAAHHEHRVAKVEQLAAVVHEDPLFNGCLRRDAEAVPAKQIHTRPSPAGHTGSVWQPHARACICLLSVRRWLSGMLGVGSAAAHSRRRWRAAWTGWLSAILLRRVTPPGALVFGGREKRQQLGEGDRADDDLLAGAGARSGQQWAGMGKEIGG